MARIIEGATSNQIKAAAKSAINETGHMLSAQQRDLLVRGDRKAQADVLRFMDRIDRLAGKFTRVQGDRSLEQLDFLSHAERFTLSIRPIPYSISDGDLQNLQRIIAKIERHDRELEVTPIEEMLVILASTPLVRPPRERREKAPRSYPRTWETAKERAHRVPVAAEPSAPKRPPRMGAKKRGVKCKKGK